MVRSLIVLLSAGLLAGSFGPAVAQQQGPAAVDVAAPILRTVREWDQYTGRFEAVDRVEVRARVSGYIEEVHFRDGQFVEEGDLLYTIDPRPFEAALARADANVARAESQLRLAELELERGQTLLERQTTSQAEVDTRTAERDAAAADLLVAQAELRTAQLDLGFARVRAEVAGRVSDTRVDVGNLISGGASASLLTTIVSLDPIYFIFDVSEAAFLKYARLHKSGERPGSRTTGNPVYVRISGETRWERRGFMDFVDNEIGQNTGTIRGRAVFDNPGNFLQPGLFGQARIVGSGEYDAVLIPDEAILSDQANKLVMVVNGDNVVEARGVELGPIIDGLRVVRDGLTGDEQVIVAGLQRVRAGVEVAPNVIEVAFSPDNLDATPAEEIGAAAATGAE